MGVADTSVKYLSFASTFLVETPTLDSSAVTLPTKHEVFASCVAPTNWLLQFGAFIVPCKVLAGLAVLAVGVMWYMKITVIVDIFGKTNDMMCLLLMAIGGLAAIFAILGCYGAFAEGVWVLTIFATMMLLLPVGGAAAVVYLYLWMNLCSLIFGGICAAIGVLEIIAMLYAFYLVSNIKKNIKKEK